MPGEGSAAGLRPFLHGGTEGKGRPFNVGSACMVATACLAWLGFLHDSRATAERTSGGVSIVVVVAVVYPNSLTARAVLGRW